MSCPVHSCAPTNVGQSTRKDPASAGFFFARTAQGRHFKLRHHVIAAMPVSGADKRKLYKLLSFERKAAERTLGMKIKGWRKATVEARPGSWKEFLAARAARGDQRALRRLTRQLRGPAIKSDDNHLRALPPRSARTSRGSIVHNLPGGIRLRESAGSIPAPWGLPRCSARAARDGRPTTFRNEARHAARHQECPRAFGAAGRGARVGNCSRAPALTFLVGGVK